MYLMYVASLSHGGGPHHFYVIGKIHAPDAWYISSHCRCSRVFVRWWKHQLVKLQP